MKDILYTVELNEKGDVIYARKEQSLYLFNSDQIETERKTEVDSKAHILNVVEKIEKSEI